MQRGENAEQNQHVDEQRNVGDEAGHAIHPEHEEHDEREPDGKRRDGFVFGILPQRRADGPHFHDGHFDGKRAAAEQNREILRFVQRALPGNHRRAARDRIIDDRIRQKFAVEINPDVASDIRRSERRKFIAARVRELQRDDGALILSHLLSGIFQVFARQTDDALFILKFEDGGLANRFNRLLRILFARKLDDNPVSAFALNNRLSEPHLIDALLHDINHLVHGFRRDFVLLGVFRLHDDMRPALQIEPLPNAAGEPSDGPGKNGDNDTDDDKETQ